MSTCMTGNVLAVFVDEKPLWHVVLEFLRETHYAPVFVNAVIDGAVNLGLVDLVQLLYNVGATSNAELYALSIDTLLRTRVEQQSMSELQDFLEEAASTPRTLQDLTKDQFLSCVDNSLNKADGNSVVQLFRPLFNVSLVTEAYNDLCSNLTVTENEEDLSCLINSTALLPCYNEYYNYLFYLSVVKQFGSPQRQLSDEVVNTLLCTLAEERRDCEVEALSKCSTKIGHVMQAFYQKTLPSACIEEEAKDKGQGQ
nr:hypothetical protein BaRGS_002120 [Batillaria attramentaria]